MFCRPSQDSQAGVLRQPIRLLCVLVLEAREGSARGGVFTQAPCAVALQFIQRNVSSTFSHFRPMKHKQLTGLDLIVACAKGLQPFFSPYDTLKVTACLVANCKRCY